MAGHWMREYEGPRGVVYLLGIVGCVAPSTVAMFLLEPARFISLDWPRVLLLCASTGGLAVAISVIGAVFAMIPNSARRLSVSARTKAMRSALIMGIGGAFFAQCVALMLTTRDGELFNGYIRSAVWFSFGVSIIWVLSAYREEHKLRAKTKDIDHDASQ